MHNYPLDCYRYYPDGIAALAVYAGLEVLEAYAEWETDKYPLRDPEWRDCVLIARKRPDTPVRQLKNAVKRSCIHAVSGACLAKTEYASRNPVLEQKEYSVSAAKMTAAAKFYLDTGKGFNEQETVKVSLLPGEHKRMKLDLKNYPGIKRVRFDPCDEPCFISNIRFALDGIEKSFSQCNGKTPGNGLWRFDHNDPNFMIEVTGNSGELTAEYSIILCSKEMQEKILVRNE